MALLAPRGPRGAAGACGSGSSDDDAAVEAGEPVDLASAFAETARITHYRLQQSTAQTISIPALGVDSSSDIDPDDPSITGEVTPSGYHLVIDLAKVLGPIAAGIGDVGLEMWVDDQRVVIDSRDYAAVLERAPQAQLGPLEPGVSYIDLLALEAEAPDLLSAVVGGGLVDPAELAVRLPAVLEDVERVDDHTFTGTAPFAAVLEAFGTDVDQQADSTARGVALNLQVDPSALGEFYADFSRRTPADVTVEVSESGAVASVLLEADLAGLYDTMWDQAVELGLGMSPEEVAQAQAQFSDVVWRLQNRVAFEPDPDVEVPPAPPTSDDRTQVWIEFLGL